MPKTVASGALSHAVLVVGLWAAAMYLDTRLLSGTVWVALAWLWIVWPILLAVTKARSSRAALVAVMVGALVLLPTAPEIFAFTAWSIGGFAP